ncbi:MAG: diacylglycerol kinase family protein [Bacteroidales bacterium]|nr:diacylglycerol kinase family protein [Bacteroidales bacterium]
MDEFSLKKRIQSFKHAFTGLSYVIQTQHNAWIHLSVSVLVIVAGFGFNISNTEWLVIILTIGMVISFEIINTAIEILLDRFHPEYDKQVGLIKDIGAAGVLMSAICAAIIGLIIFLPKVIDLLF